MPAPADRAGDAAPPAVSGYSAEALAACERALATVVARSGSWGPRLVLVGGLAPRYIADRTPDGVEPHPGTTDLDVVVGVALEGEEVAVYRKLQQELRATGFVPSSDASYAWERRVEGIRVVMEFFCPVEDGAKPGTIKKNPSGDAGSQVSAIRLKGADLAGADCGPRQIECELLDQGGRRSVAIRVVNILPFIVLKSFALASRDKEKDAYDLVWTLRAFAGEGPWSAANAAARSPIADHPLVTEALHVLEDRFSHLDRQGPSNYARFFLGAATDDERRTRLRRDAAGTVGIFLERWTEIRRRG